MEFINKFLENKYTYAPRLALLLCLANPIAFMQTQFTQASGWNWFVFILLMVLTFVLYLLVGLGPALRWSKNLAVWGWVAVPFPYDLITFPIVFAVSLFCLFLLPFFPVRKACKEALAAQRS